MAYLVDLSPFFGRLFGEALVDHGHDFVECLTVAWSDSTGVHIGAWFVVLVEGSVGNVLHHAGRRSPGLVVGGFSDLKTHE